MASVAVQVMLVLLGVACAALGWTLVDAVVSRRGSA